MLRKSRLVSCLGLALTGLGIEAHADLVRGSFTGVVVYSLDPTNYFGRGYEPHSIYGELVSGTWEYETDLATADGYPYIDTYGVVGAYGGQEPDWLKMTIDIMGRTEVMHDGAHTGVAAWDAAPLVPEMDGEYNNVGVMDATGNPIASITDIYELTTTDGGNQPYIDALGYSYTWEEFMALSIHTTTNDNLTHGDGPIQEFDWTYDPLQPATATGMFVINRQIRGGGSLLYNEQARAYFNLTSASVHVVPDDAGGPVTPAAVPEPGTMALFGLGLLGLAGLCRKRS